MDNVQKQEISGILTRMRAAGVSPRPVWAGGRLLVVCGGVIAALGSIVSMLLLVAASGATPGNYLWSVLALAAGGLLGLLVAASGFVRLAVTSRMRVVPLSVLVVVIALVLPWLLAAIAGALGGGSVA